MNLIAYDLVMVQPMTSITGYVAYIQYTAGTPKGDVQPDANGNMPVFNDPFRLGDAHSTYTSQAIVEGVTSFVSGTTKAAWCPVIAGSIRLLDENGAQVDNADGEHPATAAADGTITQTSFKAGKSATDVKKIAYQYDNVVIPQDKIPSIKAEMKNIPLLAHARRIAMKKYVA